MCTLGSFGRWVFLVTMILLYHISECRQASKLPDVCERRYIQYVNNMPPSVVSDGRCIPLLYVCDVLHTSIVSKLRAFCMCRSQADPARQNLRNMHVFNPQGSMNNTEWRIAGEGRAVTEQMGCLLTCVAIINNVLQD